MLLLLACPAAKDAAAVAVAGGALVAAVAAADKADKDFKLLLLRVLLKAGPGFCAVVVFAKLFTSGNSTTGSLAKRGEVSVWAST